MTQFEILKKILDSTFFKNARLGNVSGIYMTFSIHLCDIESVYHFSLEIHYFRTLE